MATNDLLPTVLVSTGAAQAVMPQLSREITAQRDRFATRAGPDVSFKGSQGVTEVYAVFSIDPQSKQLRVAVVDGEGRLLRMIPPQSVSEMMQTMGRYRV